MAKNLRQKYKEAKKKIAELRHANWRLMYPTNPIAVNSKELKIRKVRSAKTVEQHMFEDFETGITIDLAFDIAKYMVKNGMIEVKHTIDPFSGNVYVFAELDIVDRE